VPGDSGYYAVGDTVAASRPRTTSPVRPLDFRENIAKAARAEESDLEPEIRV